MTKQLIIEEFDNDAVEFDIDSFLNPLFKTIDNYRSQMSLQENIVVEFPIENNGSNNSESKLNTFYRLLGFPAVRSDIAALPVEFKNNIDVLSQHSTLNYFNDFTLESESVANLITKRESALYAKIDFQRSIDVVRDPLSFMTSINGSARKPSIFPLAVSAAVPVFPIAKRTAPLFYDGDFILFGDQKRLTRPFIEHIIYMRTKVFAGFDAYSDSIKKQINDELVDLDVKTQLLKDISKSEFLSLKIINKLLRALKQCAKSFKNVREGIEHLRKDVQYVPAPKLNPAEKTGNLPDSITNNLVIDNITEKGIENQILAIKAKMAAEDIFIKLLPSESIKKSDQIKRIEDETPSPTIVDDALMSEFNYLTNYERIEYSKQLKALEDQKARFIANYELARQSMMYLNGELTGLSIFDVLCILLALFTVDISALFAIINKDSLNSLKNNDLFFKKNPTTNSPAQSTTVFTDISTDIANVLANSDSLNLTNGLTSIQNKVIENFNIADAFYKKAQKAGENRE